MRSNHSKKSSYIPQTHYRSGARFKKRLVRRQVGFILFCLFSGSIIFAQPSGGPYGPIQQTYDLPDVAGKIYYVAPDGKTKASGKTLAKPITLEAAIERVKTGDAIVLRGGTYRTGNLILNQGITMQPYKGEQPVLKGTFVATDWTDLGNGLWTTSWSRLFPSKPDNWWRRHREGEKTPLYRFNNDMVFVDGKFLQAVGWEGEVDENTYYIDYDAGVVYIGIDPTDRLVEITAFDVALLRTTEEIHGKKSDKNGYVIRGITFTQYAYRALEIEGYYPQGLSGEADHGKDVVGTTLEHCTITFCSRVAGYFIGDSLTIRNCKVSDTSTEGVYIISSSDVLLEKNIFTRNNIEKITGYYPAAVKIFNQCYRATCNDNLVIDLPYSNGIWYDVGNVDGVFINNWVENVGNNKSKFSIERPWPSDNGFFFEISKGAICAGNVFVNCDHGLWVLNSSDVHIYNNTFVNSTACIARNERSAASDHFGWHPSTGPDVDERDGHIFINNLLTETKDFNRLLLYVWQPAALCDQANNSQLKDLDYNTYVSGSNKVDNPIILWSPVKNEDCRQIFKSLNDLQKLHPEFSVHSRYFSNYSGPLFKSRELGNYQILPAFPGFKSGMQLPAEILKLLGRSKKDGRYVGAYPPMP
ncbi:MAG: right-handed parallel beta-helix repeat-containing protein [Candidatus Marinimicrobia bacterium]|nr:right-handed parallel beta-helix repeat-containing protein [Candidatus Neomarinimicrobiota bacterium]